MFPEWHLVSCNLLNDYCGGGGSPFNIFSIKNFNRTWPSWESEGGHGLQWDSVRKKRLLHVGNHEQDRGKRSSSSLWGIQEEGYWEFIPVRNSMRKSEFIYVVTTISGQRIIREVTIEREILPPRGVWDKGKFNIFENSTRGSLIYFRE